MRPPRLFVLLAALVTAASAHEGHDHGDAARKPPVAVSPAPTPAADGGGPQEAPQRLADGSLFVPKPTQRALGLRTARAAKGDFPRVVEMPGRVLADPNAGGRVQATQAGRIEAAGHGMVVIGQRVARGETLAWLVPTLDAGGRADRQAARAELAAQEAVLEKRVTRLHQLEGSVPKKDVEQATIELDGLRARRAALDAALVGRIALTAPAAGVVAAANVGVGQVVEAKETLFEIIDPRRLAVEALAFDAAHAAGFETASAAVPGGRLVLNFVGAGRSLREQALPVLFRIEAGKGEAPPVAVGQTLKVLAATRARQAGVAVPAAAVVRNAANETVVWVHDAPERFVARRVRTAPLDAVRVVAVDGLSGDERVVTDAATALSQIR